MKGLMTEGRKGMNCNETFIVEVKNMSLHLYCGSYTRSVTPYIALTQLLSSMPCEQHLLSSLRSKLLSRKLVRKRTSGMYYAKCLY